MSDACLGSIAEHTLVAELPNPVRGPSVVETPPKRKNSEDCGSG